jgi:hypothetical protein
VLKLFFWQHGFSFQALKHLFRVVDVDVWWARRPKRVSWYVVGNKLMFKRQSAKITTSRGEQLIVRSGQERISIVYLHFYFLLCASFYICIKHHGFQNKLSCLKMHPSYVLFGFLLISSLGQVVYSILTLFVFLLHPLCALKITCSGMFGLHFVECWLSKIG